MVIELLTVPSSALTRAQADDVITLCSEVFRLDYSFYMNLGYERVHVLGYAGSRLVAHALWLTRRLRIDAGPWLAAADVEGVATHADYRGRDCETRPSAITPFPHSCWRLSSAGVRSSLQ